MKNRRIIGILFVVIALVLIAVGSMGLVQNSKGDNNNDKKTKSEKSYANMTTDRNYQASTKVSSGTYIVVDKELIKQTATNIGFKNVVCNDMYCQASANGYKDDKFQDNFSISFDNDNSINNLTTMLYYSERDFNYDKLYEDVNAIVGSYIGTEISKENLIKLKKPTKSEEANENNFIDSKFTIQMSLQYIEENGLYVYRNFIIETSKYQ